MSDFLNQFSRQNYTRSGTTAKAPEATEPASGGLEATHVTPMKSDQDTAYPNSVPWAAMPRSAAITAPEHDLEIDKGYNRRNIIRYAIIAATVIVVAFIVFLMVSMLNRVTLKNFVGAPINDAKTWGITNKISIETESVYNVEYDNNIIISQSKEPSKKIRKGSVLALQVSLGPNPDERIEIPDFAVMSITQVYEWKSQNKANSANIMQENSETVESGQFIRMEFSNTSINETNYTRKDGLLIYMSKGPFAENISVPDFKEKSKEEAAAWAKANSIEATYAEGTSDQIPKGFVISQDIAPDSKIAQNTKMTFVISSGKAVIVPNFNTLTKDEAMSLTDLSVTVKTQYSATVSYGRLISQSVPAGKQLIDDAPQVTVIYSEGRPYIDDLTGKSEKDLPAYFYEFTSKGARITYSVNYVGSAEPKGQVVWMSVYSQFVELDTPIQIHVSQGNM